MYLQSISQSSYPLELIPPNLQMVESERGEDEYFDNGHCQPKDCHNLHMASEKERWCSLRSCYTVRWGPCIAAA